MPVQIQIRNGTAAQWTAANPTLAAGEVGIETDTRKQKFGDGTTAWNSLSYAGGTGTVTSVGATSPVASSGGATPTISLNAGYGDTLNPYASKTANFVLAAPNGSANVPSFRALVSADIPTLNQNTTGTAAGLSSTLAVASGGTGQTTAISAFNALAPSQSGNSGKYLTTDGTNSSWGTVSGGGSPGGANTNIQFNSSSTFGGSANLTWDGTNVQIGSAGALRLADSDSSNYASFQSPATLAANTAYTLPTALPTASGQSLQCTTAGVMSWGAAAPTAPPTVEYLVIAGGGGGGFSNGAGGGGGGAGGYRTATGFAVAAGTPLTVTVGAGGPVSSNGFDSVFSSITSIAGGAGVGSGIGNSGGSGGGASGNGGTGGPGTSGQGFAGGNGGSGGYQAGGGGGSGGVGEVGSGAGGTVGSAGGLGTASSITGSPVTYASGGGGASFAVAAAARTPGGGGKGAQSITSPTAGVDADANTGGGGGGGWTVGTTYATLGGSGLVVIRYADSYAAATSTTGSPTITVAGGYRVYKWTGNGSITF
jgi:hypothetical protein